MQSCGIDQEKQELSQLPLSTSPKEKEGFPLSYGESELEQSAFAYFTELVPYLKKNGIFMDSEAMAGFFQLVGQLHVQELSPETTANLLCPLVAKSPGEVVKLRNLIRNFIQNRQRMANAEKQRRQKEEGIRRESEERLKRMREASEKAEQDIRHTEERMQKTLEQIKQGPESKRKEWEKLCKKYAKEIAPVEKKLEKLVEKALGKDHPLGKLKEKLQPESIPYSDQEQAMAEKGVPALLKACVKEKESLPLLKAVEASLAIVKKLGQMKDRTQETLLRRLEEDRNSFVKKKERLQKEIQDEPMAVEAALKKLLKEQAEIQKTLNPPTLPTQVYKQASLSHRPEFLGGRYGVFSFSEGEKGLLEKQITKLTEKEREMVREYIRRNVQKFRTRMARNLHTTAHRKLDIPKTIKQSCKTGGVPIHLVWEKPFRSKTRLALFLDVSGSCKQASELMITFAYYMREVFPAGCLIFAFTNKIYDLSQIMEANDATKVCQAVLSEIPRAGAYSDYHRSFRSICKEQASKLTRDTLCIFIGDARNNKNPSGEEYIKFISRKCQASYWLETDPVEKWDQGDSIISTYAPYMKRVKELLSPLDLAEFIWEMQ